MAKAVPALRLLAQDAADLAVISAALQDAVAKIGDIRWDTHARTLTLVCNRFRWEAAGRGNKGERLRSALQLGDVSGVQARNLRRDAKGAVVELLAIGFEPGEAPGGTVTLTFAGGGDLRVAVDCVDVALADVSEAWTTPRRPGHPD
ncbi:MULTISPECIES: DUF2948 family protein [unclassified Caulobacter]|uniref:DUF2948 family protein n=1 Tax=unclassified Caulobacter TaxID=2648921 RepID=UPI000D35E57C|nr:MULTISPECIES: DUF2948 family protein [unclassified Caulobacter]PTS90212.1 DUF2948 domain-containing protein [Caulobacter sp. HMWF009]PTT12893.1 DUF2948 domain-containing protein [Caulobacter sp. HMWF025]PTT80202.1 DUF2948 domain-containing protein [Pseudomonas sp. HMWF010]